MRLIDADRLVLELQRLSMVNDSPYWMGRVDGINDALSYISKQRTVDAEPVRHGQLIKESEFSEPICSVCKKAPKMLFGEKPQRCPYCGAKMDLEDEA